MTAQTISNSPQRIYEFGVFIEKTVFFVVILGVLVLLFTEYLQIDIPNRDQIFLISIGAAIYTLLYHHFVYFKNPTVVVAFVDALVYSVFIFLINYATGGLNSPLFFLYLLPIISVRLNLGSKLPLAITLFIAFLNIFQLIIQANPSFNSLGGFFTSIQATAFYSAATNIISILLVGLYIRSISIEFSQENEQVNEIKRLNYELKRIDRGKDEFISIASHEIRTPLTALRGGLELLSADGIGKMTKEQKDFIIKLLNAANRLGEVAENSLNISALEIHHFTLKIEPFDLSQLITEVLEEQKDSAAGKKVQLEFPRHPANLPKVLADRGRIETVLRNLIDNAIKFTPSGGKINVFARSSGSRLIVSVEDSGVGIPKEELSNLFRKFYRVENVLSESSQGTGLGLYIVKLIINLHGETIGVESELGKGSTFTFTLKAVPHG